MINIIFRFKATDAIGDETYAGLKKISEWVEVYECRHIDGFITYQAISNNLSVLEEIKVILEQFGILEVIGIWDASTGLQYGYKINDTDENNLFIERDLSIPSIKYPFNFLTYRYMLKDEKTYDEYFNKLTSTRPTILKQVNKFSGMKDRDLVNYAL